VFVSDGLQQHIVIPVQYGTVHCKAGDHSSTNLSSVCIRWLTAAPGDTCTVQYSTLQGRWSRTS